MTKKSETGKDLVYYLSLPYTVVLRPDSEGDFVARIDELEGCVAHGTTASEALDNLREAQQLWIEDCIESQQPVPEPDEDEDELPSGKWVQRVPRTLHQRLARRAKREGVSLNQLVTSMLAEALATVRTPDSQPADTAQLTEPLSGTSISASIIQIPELL